MRIQAGTTALVSGASRGIGQSLARALAARGARVGLLARSGSALEQLAATLPHEPVVLPVDVADAGAVRTAVARFIERCGGLQLVVANAGIAHYGPFREQKLEAVERMTRVNWMGTVHLVSAALPHLLERGRGHLVIVSSGAGYRSFPGAAVYGATKAAQRAFGEALHHELAGTGVAVTMVYPGEIATALHDHEKDTMPAWYRGGPQAASPDALAQDVLEAVESERRAVHHPQIVRLLGAVHGLSPRASDLLLRTLRGSSAAPRRH